MVKFREEQSAAIVETINNNTYQGSTVYPIGVLLEKIQTPDSSLDENDINLLVNIINNSSVAGKNIYQLYTILQELVKLNEENEKTEIEK